MTLHTQPYTSLHAGGSSPERDAASERDREYFDRHPGMRRYVRRRIIGEFGENLADDIRKDAYTEVEQVAPGLRTRTAIRMMRSRDYPTGQIPVEHLEAFIAHTVENGDFWRPIPNAEVDDGEGGAA
jgi:hypothetical protein